MDSQDIFFMLEALKEAKKGFELNEVPVGAILVYKGEIIARAHNLVESEMDATAHAEMLCLKQGSLFLNNWRLCMRCSILLETLDEWVCL